MASKIFAGLFTGFRVDYGHRLIGVVNRHTHNRLTGRWRSAFASMTTSTTNLLGPPSIAGRKWVNPPPAITFPPVSNDDPPMGWTENGSPTYLSTGNPCLDFFFHVVPNTPAEKLVERLEMAWAHDSETALKLIANLRGVRGTGKLDKEGFYAAALWLHTHHPKTLALNARVFSEFGYFKDFVEILYRILEGLDVRQKAKKKMSEESYQARQRRWERESEEDEVRNGNKKKVLDGGGSGTAVDKETARELRHEREIAKAVKALDKYNSDPNYRFLFDSVADLFADLLKSDMNALKLGKYFDITLAAKWCPSLDTSYDKSLLMCEAIARRVFPKEGDEQYQGLEEAHYAYRVRDRLRKEILVPLHKALELPELYMSAGEWNALPYSRVASVAMKRYKEHFTKHDKERFDEYKENVRTGKAKIAAGAVLPHEIIAQLHDEDGGAVAELQWARMVEDMLKEGKMTNCIAVCDVSGSMSGTPMEVCVALGLLVSELSEEPWKGKVITFSENPEMHLVQGSSLMEKTDFIRNMQWNMSTDFQKVFDKILETAVANNLTEDQLIKRVFVFSDMEFNQASDPDWYKCSYYNAKPKKKSEWETDYQVIQRKFGEKGYKKVPEIVFWNLRESSATPVLGTQNGVALVSGFSKNMLKMFIADDGIVNPEKIMGLAIAGEEYQKLVVYD